MSLPLNLAILRTVQEFGKIPRGLLYDKVGGSSDEVDRQLEALAGKGAVKMDDEHVMIPDYRAAGV
jgi:hypothetical protein